MVAATCPECNQILRYQLVHTGFNNTGYAYCDRDGALLVWEIFDPQYTAVAGDKHPWTLNHLEEVRVESAFHPCPCGGHFGMRNPPRCPHCRYGPAEVFTDPIYFVDLGRRFDPARDGLSKAGVTDPPGCIPRRPSVVIGISEAGGRLPAVVTKSVRRTSHRLLFACPPTALRPRSPRGQTPARSQRSLRVLCQFRHTCCNLQLHSSSRCSNMQWVAGTQQTGPALLGRNR